MARLGHLKGTPSNLEVKGVGGMLLQRNYPAIVMPPPQEDKIQIRRNDKFPWSR